MKGDRTVGGGLPVPGSTVANLLLHGSHLAGRSPLPWAGARKGVGIITTLRIKEFSARGQETFRPGFLCFQNWEKLISQMPGL